MGLCVCGRQKAVEEQFSGTVVPDGECVFTYLGKMEERESTVGIYVTCRRFFIRRAMMSLLIWFRQASRSASA